MVASLANRFFFLKGLQLAEPLPERFGRPLVHSCVLQCLVQVLDDVLVAAPDETVQDSGEPAVGLPVPGRPGPHLAGEPLPRLLEFALETLATLVKDGPGALWPSASSGARRHRTRCCAPVSSPPNGWAAAHAEVKAMTARAVEKAVR
ncbi:hypothetical protein IQ64_03560 [Streptomyces stelliscabiei]|nr:hypothetical protein IQ64_03560 [Streptomyces stelliscabiei]